MHVFGLTGGLASGKSAVARRLRARGVPVVDADELAREVVQPGTPALAAIAATFGAGVLDPAGALDRKALAAIVFSDDERRNALNAIVHPRIASLTAARVAELSARSEELACYEAALLVENGLADAFRPLVVVAAPEEVQVARACARDGGTREQALARLRAQLPLAEKVRVADVVIENTGTLAELEVKADDALERVRAAIAAGRRK